MSNKVPLQVTLGVDRQGLQKFDDKVQLGNEEFKILGVKISLDDTQICGIAFTYQSIQNGRKIICNDTCITGKNITQYEFEIDFQYENQIQYLLTFQYQISKIFKNSLQQQNLNQDDFIQVLFGYYESGITQLGIITYKGQQAIFGKDKGYKFNYMFMGYTFTGCSGSYKKGCIESLSFKVTKLPKEFIIQQFTPLLGIIYPENPYESIILTNFEQEAKYQYEQQPQPVMQPVVTSDIIYSMIPNQTPQIQQGYPVQNQQAPLNQMPPQAPLNYMPPQAPLNQMPPQAPLNYMPPQAPINQMPPQAPINQMPPQGNPYQQPNQYQQYPNNQQYYSTPQQGNNQVIIVNQEQQPQQQQQYQKQGSGFAGIREKQFNFNYTMAKTALGTFAAIETVRMVENIGHHHHHQPNVVVVGNKHHGHHHRR